MLKSIDYNLLLDLIDERIMKAMEKVGAGGFGKFKRPGVNDKYGTHKEADNMMEQIGERIPGFDRLEFGGFEKSWFAVLFIDMRDSTKRAKKIGSQKTFVSMQAFITAMWYITKTCGGGVGQFTGDGIMSLFPAKSTKQRQETILKSLNCAILMQESLVKCINPVLKIYGIGEPIMCGIGIDSGNLIVTRVGIMENSKISVIGDSVNNAAHLADNALGNEIRICRHAWEHVESSSELNSKGLIVDGKTEKLDWIEFQLIKFI